MNKDANVLRSLFSNEGDFCRSFSQNLVDNFVYELAEQSDQQNEENRVDKAKRLFQKEENTM